MGKKNRVDFPFGHSKEIERYEREGKDIEEKYCCGPKLKMFPPVPNSKYIDKFIEGEDLSSNNRDDKKRQEDYEAEVLVYRALENLREPLVVLHGLQYTHGQCKLFVGDHESSKKVGEACKRKCQDWEGENDFLVIGNDYIVILEVKNMEEIDQLGRDRTVEKAALTNTFHKSHSQRLKTKALVEKIICHVGGNEDTAILHFSAYPNFKKAFKSDFLMEDDMKTQIIFKEDIIDDFSTWWERNVMSQVQSPSHTNSDNFLAEHQRAKQILLALWCMDQNNACHKDRFSLGSCILDIDRKLKDAEITFRRKNHENPAFVVAPEIFKDYLGIEYLTREQNDVYNSDKRFVWINGAAGCGKTILILGKIIQLVKDRKEKVLLIRFGGSTCMQDEKYYHGVLIGAGISTTAYSMRQVTKLSDVLLSLSTYQVVIVEICRRHLLSMWLSEAVGQQLTKCHVFVDDIQWLLLLRGERIPSFGQFKFIENITSSKDPPYSVWITCDILQDSWAGNALYTIKEIVDDVASIIPPKLMMVTLSQALRNTWDISVMLAAFRERLNNCKPGHEELVDAVLPRQVAGHFLHGPKPVIHALKNPSLIRYMVEEELDKLLDCEGLKDTDIGIIICEDVTVDTQLSNDVEDMIRSRYRRDGSFGEVTVNEVMDSYSKEWPAVIVVGDVAKFPGNTDLYLAMSRGRVYCSVILYYDINRYFRGPTILERYIYLLDMLEPHAQIIYEDGLYSIISTVRQGMRYGKQTKRVYIEP